jgi:hypothetical protein
MLLFSSYVLQLQFALFETASDKMVAHIYVLASLMEYWIFTQ